MGKLFSWSISVCDRGWKAQLLHRFSSASFQHLRHSVMSSFSPSIVFFSGSTNVQCLVKYLSSWEHIQQTAVNFSVDSNLGRRLRLFSKPFLLWFLISAATMTVLPAISNWSHNATMSSKNCLPPMPETNSEQSLRKYEWKSNVAQLTYNVILCECIKNYIQCQGSNCFNWLPVVRNNMHGAVSQVACVFDDNAGFLKRYWKWIYCLTRLRI